MSTRPLPRSHRPGQPAARRPLARPALLLAPLAVAALLLAGCGQAAEPSAVSPGGPAMTMDAPTGLSDGAPPEAAGAKAASADRSIVRTSTITVRVADLAASADRWRAIVAGLGGLVSDEYAGDDGTSPYASITAKVPADRLDEAIAAAQGLGQALSTSTSASDVTLAVTDLDARIAVLRASIARLRALLDEATAVADVVAVETELTARQAELDGLLAQQRVLADQVAMAAITVSLVPEVAAASAPAPGFLAGLQNGWQAIVALAGSATTILGFLLPFAGILAVLAAGVLMLTRPARRRRAGAAPHGDGHAGGDRASG